MIHNDIGSMFFIIDNFKRILIYLHRNHEALIDVTIRFIFVYLFNFGFNISKCLHLRMECRQDVSCQLHIGMCACEYSYVSFDQMRILSSFLEIINLFMPLVVSLSGTWVIICVEWAVYTRHYSIINNA